ncbi:MAG: glycosyltransferase [Patescibacteria group bacterium]
MNLLVSIIIPAFNAAAYVKEAVDSALSQTYPDTEVIVVDDGSTDRTAEIIKEYSGRPNLRYIYQENRGLAGARNRGIKESRGEFIALLDADDAFHKDKVKEQVQAFDEHPEYGVCYSDLIHFSDATPREFYHHRYQYPSGKVFEPLLRTQFINPLSVMVRRSVFEKFGTFDEALRRSEDWELWLRWARQGVLFYFLPKQLAYYRMRLEGNLSSLKSEPEMKEKNLLIFGRLEKELSHVERERYNFKEILSLLRKKLMIAYLMVGRKDAAKKSAQEDHRLGWAVLIAILPAGLWKVILKQIRVAKHRRLLEKIEKPSI